MTDKEIVQALRCTSTPGGPTGDCEKCPYWKTERLTAENAALREKQRWIPVAERLPERDVQVLGWYKDNPFSQYRPGVVAWNGNGWVLVYAHRYVANVTHWMPLPDALEGNNAT